MRNLSLDPGNKITLKGNKNAEQEKKLWIQNWRCTISGTHTEKKQKSRKSSAKINQTRSKKVLWTRHNHVQSAVANYFFVSPVMCSITETWILCKMNIAVSNHSTDTLNSEVYATFWLTPLVLEKIDNFICQSLLNTRFLYIFKMKLSQTQNVLQILEELYSRLLSQLYRCIRQLCTNAMLLVKQSFGGSCI